MKPIRFSNILGQARTLRSFRLAFAAPALVLTIATAHAGTAGSASAPNPAEAAPASNWITFGVGGAFVSGNDAAMMSRTRTNGDFYGGIDSMQITQAINKTTTMTIDGHALPGMEDYQFNLDLQKADIGYIKAGFKQYRTWYDGSGGFLSGSQYAPLSSDDLHIDRGEITAEVGLRMENLPEITFKYSHAYRNGDKDSLAWGEGMPTNINNYTKLSPATWNIDEKIDTFELNIAHSVGITDLDLGLIYEHTSYTDSRSNARGTSKNTPYPVSPQSAYRTITLTDEVTTDMFASHLSSVTRLSDNLWISGAVAYSSLDTNNDGSSRTFSFPYAPTTDSQYSNLVGGGQISDVLGNLNVMWNPINDLTITPSVRFEHEETSAWSSIPTFSAATPANPTTSPVTTAKVATTTNPIYGTDKSMTATTTALDLRYSGIPDWVLYGKCQFGYENEDISIFQANYTDNWLRSKVAVNEQEYVAGANWYAMSGLSFSLQGVHSDRNQGLDHSSRKTVTALPVASITTIRPIMTEHETSLDDCNLRVTWRPLSNLSLVTRYDYSDTEYRNHGSTWSPASTGLTNSLPDASILPEVQTGDVVSNILSESITWNPMQRMYLQGTISCVDSKTKTNSSNIVADSDNDYVTATLAVGYAIDNKTDITASCTYYGAGNYNIDNKGIVGYNAMSYGLNTQEYAANVTLTRALTPNMVWNLRYGYINSNTSSQDQSGGFNDFSAHMISTGLQIRF